ncbi:MAG TPA: hypothetical protein VM240_05320 [Verrucomicrobiae bacterium]|nr:hypothetical protein [Verrucomicrobiae bacterium]
MRKLITGILLFVAMAPAPALVLAQDAVKSVVIPEQVAFSNPDAMDTAIVKECALPQRMHDTLVQALNAAGIEHKSVADAQPKAGANVLQLEIASASSGGNAFTGHHKTVTVTGKLFQNGKQTAKFVATRASGGGFGAGFKGSCAVLGRCTVTLGQDIARWLAAPVDGAKLGDAR